MSVIRDGFFVERKSVVTEFNDVINIVPSRIYIIFLIICNSKYCGDVQ